MTNNKQRSTKAYVSILHGSFIIFIHSNTCVIIVSAIRYNKSHLNELCRLQYSAEEIQDYALSASSSTS